MSANITMVASLNPANINEQAASLNPAIDEQATLNHNIDEQATALNPDIDEQATLSHNIDGQAAPLNPTMSTFPSGPLGFVRSGPESPVSPDVAAILAAWKAEEDYINSLPLPDELVAVEAILGVYKPQRLPQIFASLCYLLAYNTKSQDYHFIVDAVDGPILADRGIEKFKRLINKSTNSAIRLDFIAETGEMTIVTMSEPLYRALSHQVYHLASKSIAGVPGLEQCFLHIGDNEISQYVCAIKYQNEPYGLFLLGTPGDAEKGKTMKIKAIGSAFNHVTRDYPSIKKIVRLELGGLDSKDHRKDNTIEARVRHIAEHSHIRVFARESAGSGFIEDKASARNLSHEDDQFCLPLPSKNAERKTVPVLQFSDILHIFREHCKEGGLLSRHPGNKDPRAPSSKGLQASALPVDALEGYITRLLLGLHRHSASPLDVFKSGFATGINKLLGMHVQEHKAAGVGPKAPLSFLPGGAPATRRGMLPTGTAGLGPIKAGGSGRRIYGTATARNTLGSLLSARHFVGRLVRR
ncbi:hypothetical protein B0H67DRAFT_642657 [Lasiosphaeris hirsuta]|uniref:Uncharacterized protein n=1 Tax=Lasiosphaeris hirsuta TaxID=260670 RepID=A0AA40AP23_9PEZI|nr:hypothetical protein B0H67DRAFT_642657 [Lasiosphaeris hirsuta]